MEKVWKENSIEGYWKKPASLCLLQSPLTFPSYALLSSLLHCQTEGNTALLGNWNRQNMYKTCLSKPHFQCKVHRTHLEFKMQNAAIPFTRCLEQTQAYNFFTKK